MENIIGKKENGKATTENGAYEIWIKESVPSKSQYGYSTKIIRVPVTKEQFEEYYRPVNTFRRKMQRHHRCACPENMRLICDMDCTNCQYHCHGDEMSLNEIVTDEEGNAVEFGDLIPSTEDSPYEVIMKKELYAELHKCVEELPPYQKRIIKLFMEGKSEDEIGQLLSRDSKAIHYQKKRIFQELRKKLEKFYY